MANLVSSMQLTRAADYATRVMVYLAAQPENRRIFLPALAEATAVPSSFLSKVLQALSRAGMVSSRRGQQGGFQILPRGRNSTVRTVVEAIDGPINLNVCTLHGTGCNRKSWCPAHPVWAQAQNAMLRVLDEARIADLAAAPTGSMPGQPALARNPRTKG
jgi:Rrf2 family protein